MIKKNIDVSVDSKFAVTYIVVNKNGMHFADPNPFGKSVDDAIKLRKTCETKLPQGAPYTIYRVVHTYQKVDVWAELCQKMDNVLSSLRV
jgi:ABC-type phosphate transport system ATPase subunit